jgi:hypothetical protein
MRFIALLVWFITALWGLYMLAVWLIENDATRQDSAPSRLPLPVILGHVVLALTGLVVWVVYLLLDRQTLAWAAVGILIAIATLGLAMFARWIPVYRTPLAAGGPQQGGFEAPEMPAEGSFPVVIVLAHGTFAVSTVVLVLLTALGVGGSLPAPRRLPARHGRVRPQVTALTFRETMTT